MGKGHRGRPVNGLEVIEGLLEKDHGLVLVHIAHVLADYRPVALEERKGVLHVRANGQHVRAGRGKRNGLRRIASGAADEDCRSFIYTMGR